MIVEILESVTINVEAHPNGSKSIVIDDQQAARQIRVQMPEEVAKTIGSHLTGTGNLMITRNMPKGGPGMNGGG